MDEETLQTMQSVTDPREMDYEALGKLSPAQVPDMRERGLEKEVLSV